jgi:hypothetical protein
MMDKMKYTGIAGSYPQKTLRRSRRKKGLIPQPFFENNGRDPKQLLKEYAIAQ